MIFANGVIVDGNFKLRRCDMRIAGEKITEIDENLVGEHREAPASEEILDMSGRYILPGFIDTHLHGAYGARISDKQVDLR